MDYPVPFAIKIMQACDAAPASLEAPQAIAAYLVGDISRTAIVRYLETFLFHEQAQCVLGVILKSVGV